MSDPYEEERRARFLAPVDALLTALDLVHTELLEIKKTQSPEQCNAMFDKAMDLLFNTLRLCKPMAMMETRKDRVAFLWNATPENCETIFYWIVCRSEGTHKFGTATNQNDCEVGARTELEGP